MGFILLGHGDLEVDPTSTPPDMDIVAIPLGTTIQFFADAGQDLCYGAPALDDWDRLEAPWPALNSSNVTYNLSLCSAWGSWDYELKNDPHFGGHQLIRPGIGDVPDPIRLCTGSAETCPTDPRMVAEGQSHTCDGILGRAEFQGQDLFWVACAPIGVAGRSVVDAALEGMPRAVLLGDDPDRIRQLDEAAWAAIDATNLLALERAGHEQVLSCCYGGSAFLVGDHDSEHEKYVAVQDHFYEGSLMILKEAGPPHTPLTVLALDIPEDEQGFVTSSLTRLAPSASVRFVRSADWSSSASETSGSSSDSSGSSGSSGSADSSASSDSPETPSYWENSDSASEESDDGEALSHWTIRQTNRLTLATCVGKTVGYCGGGDVFLIGTHLHANAYVNFVRAQQDRFEGKLTVLGSLRLRIADLPPHHRLFVEKQLLDQFVGIEVDFR